MEYLVDISNPSGTILVADDDIIRTSTVVALACILEPRVLPLVVETGRR